MSVSCDPNILAEAAKCFECLNESQREAIANYLLCQIANGQVSGVKIYVALMTQTGINAPTVTILQNTLGAIPVWTYNGPGDYAVTLAGAFPNTKTVVFVGQVNNPDDLVVADDDGTGNGVEVQTISLGAPSDGVLNHTSIEIRVYP